MQRKADEIKANSIPLPWFRFYHEALDDPKVQRLDPVTFKYWVNMLCLAAKNGGSFENNPDRICWHLRISPETAEDAINTLIFQGLLDFSDDGRLQPHNWNGRQFKGDDSRERVKRHRQRRASKGLAQQHYIKPADRESIYDRDGRRCVYCHSDDSLTIDHKTPEERGGSNARDNLQTCCRKCNSDKRNMTHEEYLNWPGRRSLGHVTGVTVTCNALVTSPEQSRTETEEGVKVVASNSETKIRSDCQEAFDLFHTTASRCGLSIPNKLTKDRSRKLKQRLDEYGIDGWKQALANIERSSFLTGGNDRGWKASLDFLLQPTSFSKVHDGAYGNGRESENTKTPIYQSAIDQLKAEFAADGVFFDD